MSVVLKLPDNSLSKNVYLIYDFKQVKDSILLIMYVDEIESWKKFFIYFKNGIWETDVLASSTNDETYKQICNKLEFIFSEQEHMNDQNDFELEKIMQENTAFMLGVNN